MLISEPSALSNGLASTDVSCFAGSDGTASLSPTGGTAPYNTNWFNADTNALSPGYYTYNLIDANGCIINDSIEIIQLSSIIVTVSTTKTDVSCYGDSSGTASLSISGGTAPYSTNWFGANTNALSTGYHPYTVTDINSCSFTDSVLISEPSALSNGLKHK